MDQINKLKQMKTIDAGEQETNMNTTNNNNGNVPSTSSQQISRQNTFGRGLSLWRMIQNKTMEIQKNEKAKEDYLGIEVNDEIKLREYNHEQNYLVIMPDHKFRLIWNFIIVMYMVYVSTYFTFRVCFEEEDRDESSFWQIFDSIMNYIFMLDIVLNFFTAYYDEDNVLVVNNKYIILTYLKGWFTIDFISVFPFEKFVQAVSNTSKLLRLPQVYKLVKVPKIAYVTQNPIITVISNHYKKLSTSQKRILKILFLSTLLIHLSACIYYLIGKTTYPNWISVSLKENNTISSSFDLYLMSICWSLQTLTTVGFGDKAPQNVYEIIFSVFWMIVGGAFYSLMISNLHSASQSEGNNQTLIHQLNQSLILQKELNLQMDTAMLIKKQIEQSHKQFQEHHLISNTKFIDQLPYNIKSHLLICVYYNILNITPFFAGKHINLIKTYIPKLEPLKFKRGQKIYDQDDDSQFIYFVTSGVIDLQDRLGRKNCSFKPGDMFGEVEVLCSISRVSAAVVQSVDVSVFLLKKYDFINMIKEYPSIQGQIELHFRKKVKLMKTYFSKEDRQICSLMFATILHSALKTVQANNIINDDNVNIEQDENIIELNGYQYDKSDPITHFDGDDNELHHYPNIQFQSQDEIDNFIEKLSVKYEKEFLNYTDEYLAKTSMVKKILQDKINYYKQKASYMDFLIQKAEEIEQTQQIKGIIKQPN